MNLGTFFYRSVESGILYGSLLKDGDNYEDLRDNDVADSKTIMSSINYNSTFDLLINELKDRSGPYQAWEIQRVVVSLNTDTLPLGASIVSAKLYMTAWFHHETDEFQSTIHLVNGTWLSQPLQLANFGELYQVTISGGLAAYPIDIPSPVRPVSITLNDTGLGWLVKEGITKLGLRIEGDLDNNPPSTVDGMNDLQCRINFKSSGDGLHAKVDCEDATSVAPYSVTFNATFEGYKGFYLEVVYEGEDSPDYPRHRFAYNALGETPWYLHKTTWQTGIATGSSFTAGATGLSPSTTYYYLVDTETSLGVAYESNVKSFTTPSYDVYPSVSTVRVSSLVHRWVPGNFTLEMVLGGITSEFGLIIPTGRPAPTIPTLPSCQIDEVLTWSLEQGYFCMKISDIPPGKY